MYVESWIVLSSFIVFIVFFFIMTFVSDYYKEWMNNMWGGQLINFAWMAVTIVVFGVLMIFNVECTITGDCKYMAMVLAATVAVLTAVNIGWGIYHTVNYKKKDAELEDK